MTPVTYFRSWGFSINEGGTPINVTMAWKNKPYKRIPINPDNYEDAPL